MERVTLRRKKLCVTFDRQLRTCLKINNPLRKSMSMVMNLYGKIFTLGDSSYIQCSLLLRLNFGHLLASLCYPVLSLVCLVFYFGLHSNAYNKNLLNLQESS